MRRGDVDQLELRQVGEADPVHAVELLVEKVAALGHVLLPALALEPFANAFLRRRALHEVEPVATRPVRTFRRQDLDDLAVLQLVVERHHGVDSISEVDRGRVSGQVEDVALGCEDVDLVLKQVDLDGVEKGFGIPDLVLPLEQASKPRQLLVEAGILAAFFVSPVSGDAELGDAVHLVSADLDLDGLARVRDDGRVQRLIAVRLGHRDVVLEPARHRLPQRMDDAEHPIAVPHGIHLHTDG